MYFDKFIGIDWSGDKNTFQKGISVAECPRGNKVPQIVKPSHNKYWTRSSLIEWLYKEIKLQRNLIGFDFAFSYPFYDRCCYFPGIKDSPINSEKLWKLIEDSNIKAKNFYGGEIWVNKTYGKFFNSPKLKGSLFSSRRRYTEILAKKKILSPSPTFNCVGPGAVGTGTLAGMRILNSLKNKAKIWPFDKINFSTKTVVVEIFPSYYFRLSKIKPEKKVGYAIENINKSLEFYNSKPLKKNYIIGGPDQDDADSIISSAALRFLSADEKNWNVPNSSKKEGWIFGV